MSKEFEEWKEREGFSDIMDGYDSSFRSAFAAGRALGRREVKGEAKRIAKNQDFPEHIDCDGCRTARMIADAIEAIPEEG